MNILRFMEEFPNEISCKEHFKLQREHEGVTCKNCGSVQHYWLQSKWQGKHVVLELPLKAVPLWNIQKSMFKPGIRLWHL